MYIEISKEAAEGIAEEYLNSLDENEFAQFVAKAELRHQTLGYLIPLIRHFKAVEASMGEEELSDCGDLSPKHIDVEL